MPSRRRIPKPNVNDVPLHALVQQQLLEIWQRLLKTDGLTIDSNFFESGGNSFLALRMMVEAGRLAGRQLPLALLLRGATIRDLARHILEGANAGGQEVIPVQPGGTRTPLFFLHGDWIGGGFYCHRLAGTWVTTSRSTRCRPTTCARRKSSRWARWPRTIAPRCGRSVRTGPTSSAVTASAPRSRSRSRGNSPPRAKRWSSFSWSIRRSGAASGCAALAVDRPAGDAARLEHGKKIAFFDRTAVAFNRWWRKPLAAKMGTVLRRFGIKGAEAGKTTRHAVEDDLGGSEILDGLDFSTYFITYRLHRFAPLAVAHDVAFSRVDRPHRVAEAAARSRIDPARVKVETIPGNHTTCITQHTAELAGKMERLSGALK